MRQGKSPVGLSRKTISSGTATTSRRSGPRSLRISRLCRPATFRISSLDRLTTALATPLIVATAPTSKVPSTSLTPLGSRLLWFRRAFSAPSSTVMVPSGNYSISSGYGWTNFCFGINRVPMSQPEIIFFENIRLVAVCKDDPTACVGGNFSRGDFGFHPPVEYIEPLPPAAWMILSEIS